MFGNLKAEIWFLTRERAKKSFEMLMFLQGKTIEQDIGRGGCGQRIGLQQKFSQPLDVVECARRDNKPCHNLRALGRFAVRPSTFALM